MKKFDGKVAVITGGNSGIGLAAALLFAEEGCQIVLAARDSARGQAALGKVMAAGGQAIFIPCDVSKAEDCQRVVQAAVETFGRLDILFNNAGNIYVNRTVVNTTEDEWRSTMDANVTGTYLMSKYAIPRMAENGGGAIINNASVFGLVGGSGVAAYCAAKGAVINLTRAMALDHAGQNIRVNCVCPGSVDTPLLHDEMEALGGVNEQRPKFAARHPMNRISQPEEVARTVLFLAGADASFITGAAIPVDGGRSAW